MKLARQPIHKKPFIRRVELERVSLISPKPHVAYISHAKETAKLIEEAATSAHVNQ